MHSDPIALTIKTYDEIADAYAKKWATFENLKVLKVVIDEFIGLLNGTEVLDVGCGHGRDAAYFIKQGLHVTGIDLSKELLVIAKTNVPGADFMEMDMRKLEFPSGSFHGIWACSSFMHLPKEYASETLYQFHKVLKSHGLVYVSVTKGDGEGLVAQAGIHDGRKKYFACYAENEIEVLFNSAGFEVLRIFTTDTNNPWLNILAKKGD